MKKHLAFDVYGTLIDPSGVGDLLSEMIGAEADAFNKLWRDKQLEYSFRRGLMDDYVNFSVCTKDALNYACAATGQDLSGGQKASLLARYTELPAYPDVKAGLERVKAAGHRCFAFSNGSKRAVAGLLDKAGLSGYFEGIVSAEGVQTFKPDPAVYARFCAEAGTEKSGAVLISGNPFDVIGAKNFGMRAVWIKRSGGAIFDPWGKEPDATAADLSEAAAAIEALP